MIQTAMDHDCPGEKGMTEQKIEPSRVTKPIQFLAAWLVGLTLINDSFFLKSIIKVRLNRGMAGR
jgi:hypothetical protein